MDEVVKGDKVIHVTRSGPKRISRTNFRCFSSLSIGVELLLDIRLRD